MRYIKHLTFGFFFFLFSAANGQFLKLKSGTVDLSMAETITISMDSEDDSTRNTWYFGIVQIKDKEPKNSLYIELAKPVGKQLFYVKLNSKLNSEQLKSSGITEIYKILPEWKIDPYLNEERQLEENDSLKIVLHFIGRYTPTYKGVLGKIIKSQLERNRLSNSISCTVDKAMINTLAKIPFIYWIEMAAPNLETTNLRERTNHRVPAIENYKGIYNLTGKGVNVGEWDGAGAADHIDYDFRHTRKNPFTNNSNGRHATHVAGTVLGAGIINPDAKGMAPEANLYSYSFYGNIPAKMDTATRLYKISLTQNSYSYGSSGDPCSRRGTYDNTSIALDKLVIKYPELLHVFAAGNSRSSRCLTGGYGTVPSGFQSSKNSLAVAAVNYLDGNSWFHSYGPVKDGRLKPEISAVGVSVYSTFPYNTYRGGYSGTSMACPGVSGTAALIIQLYNEKYKKSPPANLIKGLLCNGAVELGRKGPDYQYGFGRLNAFRTAQIVDNKQYALDSVNQSGVYTDTIFVNKNKLEFKIMLCYDDKAGTVSSAQSLVNDLDLTLKDSAGNLYKPWVLDPSSPTRLAVQGTDTLNNIEQITIDNPSSSYYIYTVKGTKIPSGKQGFSVNWLIQDSGLKMVYPNGYENWIPPSSSSALQTIRWDANGISGTGKLEYSLDSGANWNTISSSVNVQRGYYNWSNCPTNTSSSKVLIKISKGNFTDSSDAVFTIFKRGPVASAITCSEQLHIKWSTVTDAASYNVYMNDSGKVKLMGNSATNNFTIRNLNDSTNYWVSISAVSAQGAEGPRSIAKKFKPDSNNIAPYYTLQPKDTTICSGSNVVLKSTLKGKSPIAIKWQTSSDSGATWQDINTATTNELTLTDVKTARNSHLFRVSATNYCQSIDYSEAALLNVDSILPYSYPIDNYSLCIGQDTVLHLKQAGNNINLARWYYKKTQFASSQLLKDSTDLKFELLDVTKTQEGFYYADLLNACGVQSNSLSIFVKVRDQLSIKSSGNDTVCNGQTANIQSIATGGDASNYSYYWFLDSLVVQGNILVRKTDTTETWTCAVFDNCSKDTVFSKHIIFIRPIPQVRMSPDTTICEGTSAVIRAYGSGGTPSSYHYLWTNSLSDSNIHVVYPQKTTYYSLIFTDSCSSAIALGAIKVTVLDSLKIKILSTKDSLCYKEPHTLTLEVNGGTPSAYAYKWADNSTKNSLNIAPDTSSYYSVTLSDGCSNIDATDTFFLPVRHNLSIEILGPDTLCIGQEELYSLKTNGGLVSNYVYNWFDGSSKNSLNFKGLAEKVLTVELTDGCTPKSVLGNKIVKTRKPLKITSPDINKTVCHGEPVELTIELEGGLTKDRHTMWSGKMNDSLKLPRKFYSSETVQVILFDNCTEIQDTINLNINVLPQLKLDVGEDIYTCDDRNEHLNLIANGGQMTGYKFELGSEILKSSSLNKVFDTTQTIVFKLTDGCSEIPAFDTVNVFINTIPTPIFLKNQANLDITVSTSSDNYSHYWGKNLSSLELNNDSLISFNFSSFGSQTVCLSKTDSIGCIKYSCDTFSLFDVFQTQEFLINIYPNPIKDNLTIELDKIAGNLQANIYSSEGKKVWEESFKTFNQTIYTLPTKFLANGSYTLEIKANEDIYFFKLIKL